MRRIKLNNIKVKNINIALKKIDLKNRSEIKRYLHIFKELIIENVTLQRVGITLFCFILLFSGYKTIGPNLKSITSNVIKQSKQIYNDTGSLEETLKGAISSLESGVSDKVYGKESYINLYGLSERVLGKHYLQDVDLAQSIIKDNNGQLQFAVQQLDTSKYVEGIKSTYELLEAKDIPMLYVQTPVKVIEGYTEFPPMIEDYTQENTSFFKDKLLANNIPFLDLRNNIDKAGIEYDNLFFHTDHHWTTRTAFWAVGEVVNYIEENTNLKLDEDEVYTNIDNYHSKVFANSFLGSQGRRVGKYYGGVDDYELLYPKFETDYKVTINKGSVETVSEGGFQEAIIKKHLLAGNDVFTNRYASYFGGDYPEVILENNKINNDIKVLIIKDSFALPFSAFFSTMVEETRMLDTRYYDGTIEEYINAYNPDLVLYVYKSINTQK